MIRKKRTFWKCISWVIMFTLFSAGFASLNRAGEVSTTIGNKSLPKDGFKVSIIIEKLPRSLKPNQIFYIPVKLKNIGNSFWPAVGQPDNTYRVTFSYHWLSFNGKMAIPNGLRTYLPHDIQKGEEVTLDAIIEAPEIKGVYILEFDMVQEKIAWFKDKGSQTTKIEVRVE